MRYATPRVMRRLLPLDKALLLVLVPLWGLCFVLYLDDLARGRLAWVPLAVARDAAGGYPTMRGPTGLGRGWDAGDVRIGDRLLRLGDTDLRGVGQIGFVARAYQEAYPDLRVRVSLTRDGRPVDTWLILRPLDFGWRLSVLTLPFVVMAVLIVVRLPGSALARAIFLATMVHAFHWTAFYGGPRVQTYAALATFSLTACVGWPLALRLAWIFPEASVGARFREPTWVWMLALSGPIVTSWFFGVPWIPYVVPLFYCVGVAFSGSGLALGTRAFLRADPIGRRQLKWALYGGYVGYVPVLVTTALGMFGWLPWRAQEMATVAIALTAVFGFIAIVRFDLFDIDRLISTTATYSVLSTLLLAAALVLIPRLSQAITAAGAIDPVVSQPILALLLAGLLIPAQRYLRPQIERLFFVERYALQRGIERLLRDLSACDGPDALLALVGERLATLIRPECCVVYGRAADTYVPVFVRGPVVPPPIGAQSGVVTELEARNAPLDVRHWRQGHGPQVRRPADMAALDSLSATVLLPVGGRQMLPAFLCLGEKRSGDVYTATDLVLLAAVAEKTSSELDRFDRAEISRQARAMQDALRRYVPEPVAARVVSGEDLDMGERDISVLFVDLRGYTTYSEGRTAAEIFSTINRYTENVSRVIRAHGGTVVEFNGDGMMAVFGAPELLTHKERAAVEAGYELITAVRSLELGGARPLDVGVGIATGKAFVGNIRSADRWIWSAIGNTTNLAARLQTLTRELQAAITLDATTWSAAGPLAAMFQRRGDVPIRGRRQREDVYVLPLAATA